MVQAFLAAGRNGDFDELLSILHPDVVLRVDLGSDAGGVQIVRGANEVAGRARGFRSITIGRDRDYRIVEIGDLLGVLTIEDEKPVGLLIFTSDGGVITELQAPAWPPDLRA